MSPTRIFRTFNNRRMLLLAFVTALVPLGDSRCEPPARTSAKLELKNCTVDLIDHAVLASDRNGVLAEVPSEEGHHVVANAIVARLRDDVAKAQLRTAMAEAQNDFAVKVAAATKDVAETEYGHMKDLLERKAETQYRARRAELIAQREGLSYEQARHELMVAGLRLAEARARLREYQIVAPFEGTVIRRFKSAGEAVRQGDPVVELASIRRLKVEGYASPPDCRRLKHGMPVKVVFDVPGGKASRTVTLEGKIRFVGLTVVPVSGKIRVWAEVDNTDELLRPGTECTIKVSVPSH